MAPGFIKSIDPYNISLPQGLSKTQTNQGGTAYVDASGNLYLPTNGGYQLSTDPSIKQASSPIAMNTPQAPALNQSPGSPQSAQAVQAYVPGFGNVTISPNGDGKYTVYSPDWHSSSVVPASEVQSKYPDAATQLGIPSASSSAGAGSSSSSNNGGISNGAGTLPMTGNPQLDQIQSTLEGMVNSGKATIPPGLQITPALTQTFLAWAHQAVDPQTQQLINNEITNINASLKNMATQYENAKGATIQQFGTDLANEQNTAGASGTAMSGLRNLTEGNMVASTNRTLSGLQSQAETDLGAALRGGAADVGSANAGGLNTPSLNGIQVSNTGGSRGSLFGGSNTPLNYGYNPSDYTVGAIPTAQNTAVDNRANSYLDQYTTLAGNNSSRSITDLLGMIPNRPTGSTIPTNLQ